MYYLIAYAHAAGPRLSEKWIVGFCVCYVCGFAGLWFVGLLRFLALCAYELNVFEQKDLSSFENKVLKILKNSKIDMICLAGFMKILSKFFIKEFGNPILNIHPSLLPKYKGLNTHYRVLQNKEKYSGSTVHIVSPKLDSGKIILQKKVKISRTDNLKTLEKKVLKIEHKIYNEAICNFLTNL